MRRWVKCECDGFTASHIATALKRMGSGATISPSAVIGKVHRLGLPGRATEHRKPVAKKKKRRVVRPVHPQSGKPFNIGKGPPNLGVIPPTPLEPYEELVIPVAERKSLIDLESHHCRWPIHSIEHPEFHFCGKDKVKGLSYCEFHVRRAFKFSRPKHSQPTEPPSPVYTPTRSKEPADA